MSRQERIILHLDWMIEIMKWYQEQTGINAEYSPELKDAIGLLNELKTENTVFLAGRLH